jgi:hypothetical protein
LIEPVERWKRHRADRNEHSPMLPILLKATVATEAKDAEGIAARVLQGSLRGKGGIDGIRAVRLARDIDCPATWRKVLDDLARRIFEGDLDHVGAEEVQRLGEVWQPENLEAIGPVHRRHRIAPLTSGASHVRAANSGAVPACADD